MAAQPPIDDSKTYQNYTISVFIKLNVRLNIVVDLHKKI